MPATPINVDVAALGRAASDDYAHAVQFVLEDLHSGLLSEQDVARGLGYPLKRLRGLNQITDQEEEQLGALILAVSSGGSPRDLVDALEQGSPVAAGLARLIGGQRRGPVDPLTLAAGAIAGAYLGITLHSFSSPGLPRDENGAADTAQRDAAICIMAAVGGALAASGIALVRMFEASR